MNESSSCTVLNGVDSLSVLFTPLNVASNSDPFKTGPAESVDVVVEVLHGFPKLSKLSRTLLLLGSKLKRKKILHEFKI